MTNEDFVSYDLAMRLKQAGFDCPCRTYWMKTYIDKDIMTLREDLRASNHNEYAPDYYSAPTLSQAQKWLRDAKHVYVWVYPEFKQGDRPEDVRWRFTAQPLHSIRSQIIKGACGADCRFYESALSAGIEAALKLLTDQTNDL